MKGLAGRLTYSRVVSTLALFLALAGGAYAISLGKNDVRSPHIKRGAVKSSDVADNKLKGRDIKRNSLKGSDILETSLDPSQFTAAASLPFDPAGPLRCDPEFGASPAFLTCAELTLTTPTPGRILVVASGELVAQGPAATFSASCRVDVDEVTVSGNVPRTRDDHSFALTGVSALLPSGRHAVALRCTEAEGEAAVDVTGLSALQVGGK